MVSAWAHALVMLAFANLINAMVQCQDTILVWKGPGSNPFFFLACKSRSVSTPNSVPSVAVVFASVVTWSYIHATYSLPTVPIKPQLPQPKDPFPVNHGLQIHTYFIKVSLVLVLIRMSICQLIILLA